jgi:hypothetical protein
MALTTVLHFERYLISCPTIREAAQEAIDIVEELQARGRGKITSIEVDSLFPGTALVEFRVENDDEIPDN